MFRSDIINGCRARCPDAPKTVRERTGIRSSRRIPLRPVFGSLLIPRVALHGTIRSIPGPERRSPPYATNFGHARNLGLAVSRKAPDSRTRNRLLLQKKRPASNANLDKEPRIYNLRTVPYSCKNIRFVRLSSDNRNLFCIFANVSRLDPDGRTVRETNEGTPCESATVTAAVCLGFFSARVAEKKRNVPKRMPLAFGPGRLRSGDESEDRPDAFRLQPAVYGPVIRPELLCGPVFPVAVLYDNVRRL